ncbi:MAG TPA: cystathionine gamma-synthase [Anaerolineales bacterium]
MEDQTSFETQLIHAGPVPDPAFGAVVPPIYLSSTYQQRAVGEHRGYDYSRTANPTRTALETTLATLEGGVRGLAYASGMAAIDAVLRLLRPGDHILAANDLYGGSYRLFHDVYAQFGLQFSYCAAADAREFLDAVRPDTRLIWLESPTNPLLNLCDIAAICAQVRRRNPEVLVAVDNTFATPYLQRPLELGADLVVHSTTKYLGGHSDVVGGAVVAKHAPQAERLQFLQNAVGAVPGAFDCFLTLRGMRTLALRMDRHASNALAVAEYLAGRKEVSRVHYPGLTSHPQHDLAMRQMRNPGGMVSFELAGGAAAARRFAQSTRLFILAESLGAVESLVEVPAAMTHASTLDSPLAVEAALVRLSVGIEGVADLLRDVGQALDASG